MIFDSVYDSYRGVITYVRVFDGQLSTKDRGLMMSTLNAHEILEVGVVSPDMKPTELLSAGLETDEVRAVTLVDQQHTFARLERDGSVVQVTREQYDPPGDRFDATERRQVKSHVDGRAAKL